MTLGTTSGTPGRMYIFQDNPAQSGTVGNYDTGSEDRVYTLQSAIALDAKYKHDDKK